MNYNIQNVITGYTVFHDIVLVTVYNLPNSTSAIAKLFECLSDSDINVDMIATTPSQTLTQTLSFSASNQNLSKILSTIGMFKNSFQDIRTDVNTENCKITFSGDTMNERCGVAAYVFEAFAKHGVEIKLITTSETKISCLVDEAFYDKTEIILKEEFGIKSV